MNKPLKLVKKNEIEELRSLVSRTASAALTALPDSQITILNAAERLNKLADGLERKEKLENLVPSIAVIPSEATAEELQESRRYQATRRGNDVYLPCLVEVTSIMPKAFIRSALFSPSASVQANNANVLAGDQTLLVASKIIATYKSLTLLFSGYELCQFDRKVYANCLSYYREQPLALDKNADIDEVVCTDDIQTSFYKFCLRLGVSYSIDSHKAIRASLLRLSFAQLRLRINRMNIEIPKLLAINFEDGEPTGNFRASDKMALRVTKSFAELFGPNEWTSISKKASSYDGLKGWLACFYTSHSKPKWLAVEWLYCLSGYSSNKNNFKASLIRALDKLKSEKSMGNNHITAYYFSQDGKKILVIRSDWNAPELSEE
ncbi:hypothetical protein [Deefgea piscis]|uniref:hypothetical protein n=1 Tax=Deefgea piscis TaxID=2739061 RepID=UPI001C7EB5CC|nr:hypothetical protein [Deefgea piscis]QZA82268.1 hypothetical protein K4H25_06395 [Deefgea piscis]